MIVAPQGKLKIIKNVGWNNSDKHIRYFTTESDRQTYMVMKTAYTLDNYSYIRMQKVIRVSIPADDLYQCDYLMYQNKGFGDKWFYAYITDIKYVNPETSELSFEIDDFQTWFNPSNLKATFVEREHVADDSVGAHTLDEGMEFGDLNIQQCYNKWFANGDGEEDYYNIAIELKPSLLGEFIAGDAPIEYDQNQIHPLTMSGRVSRTGISGIIDKLKNFSISNYNVGKCYMYPQSFENDTPQDITNELLQHYIKRPTFFKYLYDATREPYVPKNNKLFTAPYTHLEVTSCTGGKATFRWEEATGDDHISFEILPVVYNGASCMLVASNYETDKDPQAYDAQQMYNLSVDHFPEVTLSNYEGLRPENLFSAVGSLMNANLGMNKLDSSKGLVGLSGGVSAINGAIETGMGILNKGMEKPPQTKGMNLLLAYNEIGFSFYVMGIKGEVAEIIDNYLTKFGYKVNKIKVPELTSRPSFNYVKTSGFEYNGEAPNDAKVHISNMFNNGVTLWHTNDIGNYGLDNSLPS